MLWGEGGGDYVLYSINPIYIIDHLQIQVSLMGYTYMIITIPVPCG